jgi:hypothetical protein
MIPIPVSHGIQVSPANNAARISANKLERAVLRERNPSARWFTKSFKFQIALLYTKVPKKT